MNRITFFLFILMLSASAACFAQAQTAATGRVVDAATGEPLAGASVTVAATGQGTATGADGQFSVEVAPHSDIIVAYLGYRTQTLRHGGGDAELFGDIKLEPDEYALDDVTVTSTVAVARKTPVAVSSIGSAHIAEKIGARDFPEVLNHTPGVYATRKGGGYGDSELRLRGFKGENIAVMVNGVPVNDMEHGGVYWSNWAGLADVARSVQVQRGLGAAKVSAPSVGGSVNIITSAIDAESGGFASYAAGDHGYGKATFKVSSGLTEKGWAATILGGRTWGDGYIQGTEFESYNWFVNVARRLSGSHRLSLTAFGAPQKHYQRGRYDGLTVDGWQQAKQYMGDESPYRYNPSYGFGPDGERKTSAYNVYHKPQISLNHLWQISETSNLSTAAYVSLGRGYGYSGIAHKTWNSQWYAVNDGVLNANMHNADGTFAYGKVYAMNADAATDTILAMSRTVNDHDWYGLLSTYSAKIGENVDFYGGVDFRYYIGDHYNTLDDLYGAAYYIDDASRRGVLPANNPAASAGSAYVDERLKTGDVVVREYAGTILQEGVFAQAEYNRYRLQAFVAGSVSSSTYWRRDMFYYGAGNSLSAKENFMGFTAKGGANYNLNGRNNVFANIGYISRAPFFGGVFLSVNSSNIANPDAVNEKVFSMELGYGYRADIGEMQINAYRTVWMDKSMTKMNFAGADYITLNMSGVDARHEGIEMDAAARPFTWLEITAMASFGWWRWTGSSTGYFYASDGRPVKSVSGTEIEYASGAGADDHARTTLELDGVKVGGAAQTTASVGYRFKPIKGLYIGMDYLQYARNYADWSFSASDLAYNGTKKYESPWEMPPASVIDLSAGYGFKLGKFNVSVSANVFNLFNEEYIADATDGAAHSMETAYGVFYGFRRTGSVQVKVAF